MFMIHRPGAGDLETPVKRRILLPYSSSSALHVKETSLWLASATWNECSPSDRRHQKLSADRFYSSSLFQVSSGSKTVSACATCAVSSPKSFSNIVPY